MKFVFLISIIIGLVNLIHEEKDTFPIEEAVKSIKAFFKESLKIGQIIKTRVERNVEYIENYKKNIIPWYNHMQNLIENFYIEYNPEVIKMKNSSYKFFQENFHEMTKKLNKKWEYSLEIFKMFAKELNDNKNYLDAFDNFYEQNSLAKFVREHDLEKFEKDDIIYEKEKLKNSKYWKEFGKVISEFSEKYYESLKKRDQIQINQQEIGDLMNYVTNRLKVTEFMINQLRTFSKNSKSMAMKDIFNNIGKYINESKKDSGNNYKREDLMRLEIRNRIEL